MKVKGRKKNVVVASQKSSNRKVDSGVKIKDPVVPSQQGSTTKEASSVQRKVGGAVGIKQLARSRGPMKSPPIDEEGNYIRPTYTIYKNYMHFLPYFIHEYVKSTDDVEGDGNCGYHVFVDQLGPFEEAKECGDDQIIYVRQKCLLELRSFPDFYKPMKRFERDDTEAVLNEEFKAFELRLMGNITLTSEYWMRMSICGYLLANAFYCVIHYISYSHSVTYAPTRFIFTEEESPKIVIMGFVNMNHYIGLQLKDGFPLPPLRKGDGGDREIPLGWCHRFEERFQLLDALQISRDGPCLLMTSDEDDYE
ncbi:uncharacterized protein LOC113294386 [Papaver somniferum]|uniref:uncharacterized protein LOC113294386 n=1 Tax=Papaver somniferum TaxID=3469 RepID=UPI000E6FDB0E|nr:uncharacterized protein LOC113294386 [Papaver somniferum]